MMRPATDVLDPILLHLTLEAGLAPPIGVLPAVVGEHLPRHTVVGYPATVGLQDMFGRLTAVQPQGGDVTAVIIHKADQIRVAAC